MKKRLRVFPISGVPEGTIIRITDSDFLLAYNQNGILTTDWDSVLKEHFLPRDIVQLRPPATDPPSFADFLLVMLLKPSHVAAAIGDLREHFERECQCLGQRRAVWLYWKRTFDSLWPLLKRIIGKAVKWGAVIAAVRRLF
jgi:hypothetical protein